MKILGQIRKTTWGPNSHFGITDEKPDQNILDSKVISVITDKILLDLYWYQTTFQRR